MSIQTKIAITIVASVLALSANAQGNSGKNKDKDLPPGLEKNVANGKRLPPGWQKKLKVGEPLDEQVYEYGKVVVKDRDAGVVTISVDGRLIKVVENTREIVEIIKTL